MSIGADEPVPLVPQAVDTIGETARPASLGRSAWGDPHARDNETRRAC
jgi:hypothetical protein